MTDRQALEAEMDALNANVKAAIEARTAWMDAHMADFAEWPIGTELFHLDSGRRFGVVTRHYRYWADRDPQYDTSMSINYEVDVYGDGLRLDNTSRFGGLPTFKFGTWEQVAPLLGSQKILAY